MRTTVLVALTSLLAAAALPAHATLADRKSDETHFENAQPAPYSGQLVIRGEIQDRDAAGRSAEPAPLRIPANVTGHSGDRDRFAHGHHTGVGFVL